MNADPQLIANEMLALGATLARAGATKDEIVHVLCVINELGAQYAGELNLEGLGASEIFDRLLELVMRSRIELINEVAVRELELYRLRRALKVIRSNQP
jgi:hypothetical protein